MRCSKHADIEGPPMEDHVCIYCMKDKMAETREGLAELESAKQDRDRHAEESRRFQERLQRAVDGAGEWKRKAEEAESLRQHFDASVNVRDEMADEIAELKRQLAEAKMKDGQEENPAAAPARSAKRSSVLQFLAGLLAGVAVGMGVFILVGRLCL